MRDSVLRKWLQIQAAERASSLDRVNRSHRSTWNLANMMQNATKARIAGKTPSSDELDKGAMDEDMSVSVGDTINYHMDGGSPKRSSAGPLAALAAALLLGPAGAVALNHYLSRPVVDPTKDTDTRVTIRPDNEP